MTAINVIKQANAVHDGASWVFNGGFGPACCKAFAIPHLSAVVSGRGPRLLAGALGVSAGTASALIAGGIVPAGPIALDALFHRWPDEIGKRNGIPTMSWRPEPTHKG